MNMLSRPHWLGSLVFVLSAGLLLWLHFSFSTPTVFAQSTLSNEYVNTQPSLITDGCAIVTDVPQQECLALEALFNSTNGNGWITRTGWLQSPNVCSWHGITCANDRVTILLLASNQLQGAIPPEIKNLTRLERLDLRLNYLTGTIPIEIGNLTKLRFIDLSRNRLSGEIPKEIGNLTNLQTLGLYTNQLSGGIPTEIKNLTQLEFLGLQVNDLSGVIPSEIGNLTMLKALSFTGNQLIGRIPKEIGNLTNLTEFHLSDNQLTGAIPTEIGNLVQLEWLGLGGNFLTGEIPPEIGNLNKLIFLSLAANQLSGSIPETIGNLTKLEQLYLQYNRLNGGVPGSIGNLTKLQIMTLAQNQFDGPLPDELSKLEQLNPFDFQNTKLCEAQTPELQNWLNQLHEKGGLKSTELQCPIKLSLAKSVSPAEATLSEVTQGVTATVGLTVTANSTTTIVLTETIPAGMLYVPESATAGMVYNPASRSLVYMNSMLPHAPLFITYKVAIDPDSLTGTVFSIITQISGTDAESTDETATVVIPNTSEINTLYLVYAGVDNDLSNEGMKLLNDAENAFSVQTNSSNVAAILLDGPESNDTRVYIVQADPNQDRGCPSYEDPTCHGRYKLGETLFEGLSDDTTSEVSLSKFIADWINANKSAKQIVLSLVGHGSGWSVTGFGDLPKGWHGQVGDPLQSGLLWDESTKETISTKGLRTALEDARKKTGRKLSLIYFDACSMAMAEVAYEIKAEADYMLASENEKWASFPYGELLSVIGNSGEEIGRKWLQIESQLYRDNPGHPFTLSLIDLNVEKMSTLKEKQRDFSIALRNQLTIPSSRMHIADAWDNTQCFDSNYDHQISKDDTHCDLGSFLMQVSKQFSDTPTVLQTAQALSSTLKTIVLTESHEGGVPWKYSQFRWDFTKDPIVGLSIYLPLQREHNDQWQEFYVSQYLLWVEDTEWDTVLSAYWGDTSIPRSFKCDSQDCRLSGQSLPVQLSEKFQVYLPVVAR